MFYGYNFSVEMSFFIILEIHETLTNRLIVFFICLLSFEDDYNLQQMWILNSHLGSFCIILKIYEIL